MVVLGDLAVQLPAVGAINIREHGDRVLRITRSKHEHLGFRNGANQFSAQIPAVGLGEIVIAGKLDQYTAEGILALRGDVVDCGSTSQLVETGNGRGAQIFGPDTGNLACELGARIRRLLSW